MGISLVEDVSTCYATSRVSLETAEANQHSVSNCATAVDARK